MENPGTEEGGFQFSPIKGPGGEYGSEQEGERKFPFWIIWLEFLIFEDTAVSMSWPCGRCF